MFKLNPIYSIALFSVVASSQLFAAETQISDVIVSHDVKHDLSLPLRYLQPTSNLLTPKHSIKQMVQEAMIPTKLATSHLIPLSGFQGIGVGLGSYQVKADIPDPATSVGMMQFVQWVNPDIAVFDKITGQVAPGFPKPGNSIWAGFGGVCETSNIAKHTVKYDQLARRWLLSQSAYNNINGPYYQCIAVSTSEDATGSYHRYAFQFDSLIDYSRLALWSDAYYGSFDLKGPVYRGALACAFERSKMLAGEPASMQCVKMAPIFNAPVLPADLDGKRLPNAGSPEYFVGLNEPFNLMLAKFHVDFSTPANTNVTFFPLAVAQFEKACANRSGQECAIQPNTDNRLNVLSDRVMSKLPYRQFRDYGSMVVTHTVQGPAPKFSPAVRWYELRLYPNNPNFNPVVYQQATFAPDSMNRFMGGIAIDRFTNIALAYSVTSSLIYPSLELASHNYFDQLNQVTIQPLVTGLGSQTAGHEWGMRSSMAVDPVDECTFWYTNEYLKNSGSLNWSTFIIKFKLAACI